jgi:transcription initiation factor IIF auxiliary subunit
MEDNTEPNVVGYWAVSNQDYLNLWKEINGLRAEVVALTIENGQFRDDHGVMTEYLQKAHRREQQKRVYMTAMNNDIIELKRSNERLIKELKQLLYAMLIKMKVKCGNGNPKDPLDDALYELQLNREEYVALQEAYISLCMNLE